MSYTKAYSIEADSYTEVIVDTAIEGKRVIGLTMRTTGNPHIYAHSWAVRSDQQVGVGLRNTYNNGFDCNLMVDVLYANL